MSGRGKGSLVIRGGRVIDPSSGIDDRRDVWIERGLVRAVAKPGELDGADAAETIDATGLWVVPGLVDAHVHLREPGYEYKETIATGTASAVAGGFTAVACMANTNPVNDNAAVTRLILDRAAEAGLARVHPVGAVTVGLRGERLAEIGEMREAGIVAVSDDGMPITDANLMRRALEYTRIFGIPVIDHAEDKGLCAGGCMHEGLVSFRLGLRGIPAATEEVMVARDVAIAEATGGRLHVAHVSTAGAVATIRAAKRRGVAVTAEAAPHHFTLTDDAVAEYDGDAKMNPPLRPAEHRDAVIEGLADGTLDVIATDHAPHHRDEKAVEFENAAFGIVGLETALPLSLRLVASGKLSPAAMIERMSPAPARILGVPGGTLAIGSPADVTILDPEAIWTVDPARLRSKSKNTPFRGREMKGRAAVTIVGGRIVYDGRREASS